MSYILDALKKAESERERGAVPGLNSAQANHATYIHYGGDTKPWWIVALVVALMALAAALWAWRQSAPAAGAAPPVASLAQPEAPAQVALPAPLPKSVAKELPAPLPAALPTPSRPALSPPPPPPPPPSSAVAHVVAKVQAVPASPALPAAAAVPEPVAKLAPAPTAAPVRTASGGTPMFHELPDALRRQIPALNISGAIYSDAPPEWTLIINDQIMGKGSQVAPEVRLEEISASSAVFNYKGQRFRIDR